MSKKLNIGIIGAGMISDVHVKTVQEDGRGQVAWLVDPNPQILAEKLEKHQIQNSGRDYRDILQDPNVDAVIITSPPFTHAEMAVAVLEAGKHLLLEKPMAIHPAEVKRIIEVAAAHPAQVALECSCRHARLQPKFRMIKQMIDTGKLGEVYHIHHNHLIRTTFIDHNPAGLWALDKSKAGGGPFIDWGVYDLSFHLGLFNDRPNLVSIKSFTRGGLKLFKDKSIKHNIEEHGAAFMEFDTGLTYYYERGSGVHCEVANESRIYGTRGSLCFGYCSWDPAQLEYFYVDGEINEKHETLQVDMSDHTDDSQELMKHFLDCVLEGVPPMMPVSLAARHLDIIFQII